MNKGESTDVIPERKTVIVACGIIRQEVLQVLEEMQSTIECTFLPSSLHIDLENLYSSLNATLNNHKENKIILLYGCCHPNIKKLESAYGAKRMKPINCIELIMGESPYRYHLQMGAFFLLPDWVYSWEKVTCKIFGKSMKDAKPILQGEHKYLLAVETEKNEKFAMACNTLAKEVELPLRFYKTDLSIIKENLTNLFCDD